MLHQIFNQIVEVIEKIILDSESQDGEEVELEELLRERIELLELRIRVQQSLNSLKLKREGQGKKLPNWTFSDFKNKEDEVQKELVRNAREINSLYENLIKNISLNSSKNIVYH